ncbi:MAG TPA: CDP-alcohol phosphatidyltransferase family protein [Polyangiaceae bacterium]|jgi:phosphatidylglycerophosphate synthase|nr:CDP-alcohol phosphatidyltransferase family protein [Polyangiaceae bacterium]
MPTIAEIYRLTRKLPDLPWNRYVCRPVAAVVVHAVADTKITPNQITLSSLVVAGLAAVMLVALPSYSGLLAAVLVYEASYVLDCADGMLARLRNQQSTAGHLFDFLMDELKAFAILGASAVRLWAEHEHDANYLLLGIFGLVALSTGIALTTFVRRPEIAPAPMATTTALAKPGSGSPVRAAVGVLEQAAKLVIHYPSYIWLVALVGRLDWYLVPYVAVNALYAARTLAGVALRFGRPAS